MSKFKKGQHVSVVDEKDNFKTTGVIVEIRKGTFDKATGKYTLDIYVVQDDVNKNEVFCSKSNLSRIPEEKESSENISNKKNNKETVFQTTMQSNDRLITVVGVRNIITDTKRYTRNVSAKIKNKNVEGLGIFLRNVRKKTFSMGFSICMPEDKYDEQTGVNMAYKRALKDQKIIYTNSWSMLSDDQCRAIIQNEAEYVANNIQKYISK